MGNADELTRGRFVSRLLPFVLPSAAALAALALLIFSAAPYEQFKSYMDSLSFDGNAFTFSPHLFATLVWTARLSAAVLILAAVGLFRSRQRVASLAGGLTADTLEYVRATADAAVRTIRQETPVHLAAVLAIIILGIALRVRALWQPINYDESFTYIVYANRPWLIAWANYSEPNNHLFHTLLAHLSIGVFGNAIWALRLPALVAGCLTIPLSYAVARRLAGRQEALLVSALTATTQILIAFSVCARGYTMLVDLFLIAVLCGHDIIATRSPRGWPVFVVCCALGFFTIPVFFYPYGGLLAWLVLAGRRDPANIALHLPVLVRYTLWTIALVAVCYAPAIVTSGLRAGIDYSRGAVSAITFLTTQWRPLRNIWLDLMRGLPEGIIVALVAGAVVGLGWLWRTPGGWRLIAPLVLWPVLTVPVQRTLAPARVWIYLLPVFFVYAAAGVVRTFEWFTERLPRPAPALAGATSGALALAISLHALSNLPVHYTEWNSNQEIYAHTDLDEVAGYLKGTLAERDALVVAFPLDFPLEYYLRVHDVPIAFLRRPPSNPDRQIVLANDSAREPIGKVLKAKGFNPDQTNARLVRRFTYSALYEIQPSHRGQ